MKKVGEFIYFLIALATAMIGHAIHGDIFWAIIDFFFVPFAWLKWLICREVCLSVIHKAFDFLGN